jgi:O-antigen/teichoic acid export membrane protein
MRPVLQSLASVIGGEAAVRAANFGAVLFIAREYGKVTLAVFAVSLAVVTIVVMFADNGLQTAAILQLSSPTARRGHITGQLIATKTILLAAAAIILAALLVGTKLNALFLSIGVWIAVRAFLQSYSQLQMAMLKSMSKANWIGMIQCLHSFVLCLGIWLAFEKNWSIVLFLGWMTACQLFELLLAMGVLYGNNIWPLWPRPFNFVATIRMAAPFGIVYGLANLIVRSDTIILSMFVPLSELGAFSAANTILLMVYLSAWLFGSVLLPEMVRLSANPEGLKNYANRWARWVLLITVPGALFVSVAAPRAVVLLYGSAFATSGTLASIMAIACPLIFLNSIYTTFSVSLNRRSVFLGVYGATALATLGLDFFLGRAFGPLGIASAIVVREAGMFLTFCLLTSRAPLTAAGLELRPSSGGN